MIGAVLVAMGVGLFTTWLLRRLLGVTRGRWLVTSAAVITGFAAAMAIMYAATGDPWGNSPRWTIIGSGLVVVLSTMALVVLSLLTERHSARARWSWRHPIAQFTNAVRRGARYAQVLRIAVRKGLLKARGSDDDDVSTSRLGRSLASTFEEAGGLFVKLGQAMATQPQLVTAAVAAELARLQDQALPSDSSAALAVIENQFGDPDAVFATFSTEPAGSASIAQTYFATLADGHEVIVKVQRPGIRETVERDLDILQRLAETLEWRTEWARSFGIKELVAGFAEATREELDFRIEAANLAATSRALMDSDPVTVPHLFAEYTTRQVLVEERVDGRSIATPGALDGVDSAQREHLADALLSLMLRQMMNGEQFHADPHPGNVFLRTDGRLALIDFGAVGRLGRFERSGLVDILRGLQTDDPTLLRQAALQIGIASGRIDTDAFDRELARLLARSMLADGTLNPDTLTDALGVFRDFGIVMPRSATTLFRTIVTLQGTLELISPRYRLVAAVERVGGDVVGQALDEDGLPDFAKQQALNVAPVLARLPRDVDDVLRSLLRGDVRARVSLLSEPDDVAAAQRLVNRLVQGIVCGAIALPSALLLTASADDGAKSSVVVAIGAIGFGFSMLMLLRLLLQIQRERD